MLLITQSSSFRFGSTRLCLFQYAPFWNGSPERHPAARDRESAPRPPHTAALGVAGERKGANAKVGERTWKRSRPRSPIRRMARGRKNIEIPAQTYIFLSYCVFQQPLRPVLLLYVYQQRAAGLYEVVFFFSFELFFFPGR